MATHSDASLVILLFNEGFTFFPWLALTLIAKPKECANV